MLLISFQPDNTHGLFHKAAMRPAGRTHTPTIESRAVAKISASLWPRKSCGNGNKLTGAHGNNSTGSRRGTHDLPIDNISDLLKQLVRHDDSTV